MSSTAPLRTKLLCLVAIGAGLALAGCDAGTAVIYDEPAKSSPEQTSPPATVPATPEPSPTPVKADCLGSIQLPSGIDPRACGPMPAEAITISEIPDAYGSLMFKTPSDNIACATEWGSLGCQIFEYSYVDPPDLRVPCSGDPGSLCGSNGFRITDGWAVLYDRSDVPPWGATCGIDGSCGPNYIDKRVPVLQYGQVAAMEQYACISAESGLTCWDTQTGHGFMMSREAYSTW